MVVYTQSIPIPSHYLTSAQICGRQTQSRDQSRDFLGHGHILPALRHQMAAGLQKLLDRIIQRPRQETKTTQGRFFMDKPMGKPWGKVILGSQQGTQRTHESCDQLECVNGIWSMDQYYTGNLLVFALISGASRLNRGKSWLNTRWCPPRQLVLKHHMSTTRPFTGWWLGHPSEKYEFVNWDDNQNPILMGKSKKWQPNHQPDINCYCQCFC